MRASAGTLNRITSPKSRKEDDPSDVEDARTETSHLGSIHVHVASRPGPDLIVAPFFAKKKKKKKIVIGVRVAGRILEGSCGSPSLFLRLGDRLPTNP